MQQDDLKAKKRKRRSLIFGLVIAGAALAWYMFTMYLVFSH